jgi:energy-coupling factor transporter ATP-binding protein EcfA2
MKLLSVEVSHFKNILNSSNVRIQPDVTCIIGKNESGKTAFLQALHRFFPAQDNVTFDVQRQYPAWLEKQHRRDRDLNVQTPVSVTFKLEPDDIALVEERFGLGALRSHELKISRTYSNEFQWYPKFNEPAIIAHMVRNLSIGEHPIPTTLSQLDRLILDFGAYVDADETKTISARSIAEKLTIAREAALGKHNSINEALWNDLSPRLPRFFYFDEYSQLPGRAKIRELLAKQKKDLTAAELTARSLLELGGADSEYLLNPDYETRKRELENIANAITHEVLRYWSTNPELRTLIDITWLMQQTPQGQQQVIDDLRIRLWDDRHLLSLGFEERSTGFRWFFSFLAAFSAYERGKSPVIILLDEPGLGLHARAQKDFLRFIDERLSKQCQVIYSTHSPFMVQPGRLDRVRLAQDGGRNAGSTITDDVLSADRDTLFPLQGALGYDMAQHLFIAPHNLVVEGTSDFTYLSLLSAFLIENGREGLDPTWSIVPVGGADLIPSFVALLGNHLEVTVLVDSRKEGHQRLQQLTKQGILRDTRLVTIGEIVGTRAGEIEDLFTPDEYLILFNQAFATTFTISDLDGTDPIVKRLARLLYVDRFDHGKPATVLLRAYVDILPALSEATLQRFEDLFQRINDTLGKR